MSKELLPLILLGLDKTELTIVAFFMELILSKRYGECPGRNLRQCLDITKEQLFTTLERLVQRGILKCLRAVPAETVYIKGGETYYVFNGDYSKWIPSNDSTFYKLCKLMGLRYNNMSYNFIVETLDIRKPLTDEATQKEKSITPYEVYDLFCTHYKNTFGKEYRPLNQYRDFQTLKNIICKFSYENIKEMYLKEFINWSFLVKAKEFKGDFIIGMLPLCLKDYLAVNHVEKMHPGFVRDENGRLILKNEKRTEEDSNK